MSQIDLFCVPYAGGSATAIYGSWIRGLDPLIKVNPLEIAGHGPRMSEPFPHSLEAVVEEMLRTIEAPIVQRPYALYGHSMGTAIVYELAKAIKAAGLPQPLALFLSGRQPPHHIYRDKQVHLLPDDKFVEHIKGMDGTPTQIFESPELVKIFLPILRNDYRLIEQYRFQEPIVGFDADLVFFYSDNDKLVSKPGINEWERYTTQAFEVHDFQGGHFFLNEVWQELCGIINRKLIK